MSYYLKIILQIFNKKWNDIKMIFFCKTVTIQIAYIKSKWCKVIINHYKVCSSGVKPILHQFKVCLCLGKE